MKTTIACPDQAEYRENMVYAVLPMKSCIEEGLGYNELTKPSDD